MLCKEAFRFAKSIGTFQNSVANVSRVGATENTTKVNTERSAPLLCQLCVPVLQPSHSKQTGICMCTNIKTYILTLVPVFVFLKEAIFIYANKLQRVWTAIFSHYSFFLP